jgi:uncharacterized protein (TIGR02217 family)
MAFFEQRMNPDLSYGARGGPVYSTSKAYTTSGQRITNKNWSLPLHRYDVQHCIKTASAFEEIRNFFYVVSGAFDGFRYKDWNDYQAAASETTLTLITGSTWQMFKTYTAGNRTFSRKIQKPVTGAQVFRTRSGTTTNITATDATVATTTGIVTIANHVAGDTYTWSGDFDVPVAFVSDEFMPVIENYNGQELLISSGPILLEEIRL